MGAELSFAPVVPSDREELIQVLKEAFGGRYPLDEIVPDVDLAFTGHIFAYHFYTGKKDGKIVCAGALKKSGIEKDVWGIAWVSVLPGLQKQGYGRQIIGFLIDEFAKRRIKSGQGTLILVAQKDVFSFYTKLGMNFVDASNGSRLYHKIVDRIQ
jgi:GNAT superfamily N-acetyltransferase